MSKRQKTCKFSYNNYNCILAFSDFLNSVISQPYKKSSERLLVLKERFFINKFWNLMYDIYYRIQNESKIYLNKKINVFFLL